MLVIAALVPDTALLVPGAAGRAVVLDGERAAAVAAARQVVETDPDLVVVLAPGPVDRVLPAPARPSLRAAGIGAAALGWADPGRADPDESRTEPGPAVGASVALLLLARAGWSGPTTVVELRPPRPASLADDAAAKAAAGNDEHAAALRARGAELVAGGQRIGLVLAGSLSGRHGPSAPLTHDDRAEPLDAALLDDLAAGDEPARARLAAIPGDLAAELAVTAWAPLQAMVGAAGRGDLDASVRHWGAPLGVTYVVATWRAT